MCFRDEASYNIFKDVPSTRLSTDVAFTLDTSKYISTTDKTVLFSIIDGRKKFDMAISDQYEREIIKIARQMAANGYRIILMSFCKDEGDELEEFAYFKGRFHFINLTQSGLSILLRAAAIF